MYKYLEAKQTLSNAQIVNRVYVYHTNIVNLFKLTYYEIHYKIYYRHF